MTNIWKHEILLSEAADQGQKHIDERRSFNRFLEGGSNPHFEMLREVARLEGGGFADYFTKGASKAASYISDTMTNTTLYQASLSMEAWKKLTATEIPGFCNLLERRLRNGDPFPRDTWDVLSASLKRACANKDIRAALANRKETESLMNIFKGDARGASSKLGFFRRVWNWIRNNKMKIFSITTVLFVAYLTFCYFTAGIGCALAGKVFVAGNSVKSYLGVNAVAQAAIKKGSVGIIKPVAANNGFILLSEKAVGAIGKHTVQKASEGFVGSIDLLNLGTLGAGAKNNIFYELVGTYAADTNLTHVSLWLLYMRGIHSANTFCDLDYTEMAIDTQLWLKESKDYVRKLQNQTTKSLSDASTKAQRRAIIEDRMRPKSPKKGSPRRGSPRRGSPRRGSPRRGSPRRRQSAKLAREKRRNARRKRSLRKRSLADARSPEERTQILQERMGKIGIQSVGNMERFRAQNAIF